ncbi:MAG: hypothetical protein HRU20_08415 [Pseudomonadales bacterium]|nr:hypothetical protein [Pseudomonadales bacterium]
MCLNHALNHNFSHKKAKGFALPAAIFIITVLALITATMGRLRESSAISYGLSINSARAFYAAESAAQIDAYKILNSNVCVAETLILPAFSQCSVTTTCSNINNLFTLKSTAQCGAGIDQAQRSIEVKIK